MKMRLLYILVLSILNCSAILSQEVELTATVSKNTLGINQRLRIEFVINKQGADNFTPPNFVNFRIVGGPSQSISQSWVNGKVSFTQSYTYIIEPKSKGEFIIPPASIEYEGKTLKSKSIKIIVLDAVEVPKDPNDPNYIAQQNVHLVAEISKSKPYVGEGVYVEYKLYVSQNISVNDFTVTESPEYNGFWNQDIKINDLPVREGKYNGENYRYVVLKKALLIPTKSGKLTIDPMKMDVLIGVPTGRGDFFGNVITRNVRKTFSSAKRHLNVKQLPIDGKPDTFRGAVGNFDFTVTASRDILRSNETATVSVNVKGNGNLKLFELPDIETPSELEVYTPEQKEKIRVTTSGIRGNVSKNYTVVPQYKGKYKIPSTSFSFFNPKTKKYQTITSEDIFIDVLEGKELVTNSDQVNVTKKSVISTGDNFRYIQTESVFNVSEKEDFFQSKVFFLLLLIPLVSIPIGIIIDKRNEKRNQDILGNKLRRSNKLVKKYLSSAKKNIGNKEQFYLALEKALHNYLKAKLEIETSDISREKITELLEQRKVSIETITLFMSLLESCDLARFTPVSVDTMEEDFEKAKKVVTQIDKQM